MSKFTALLDACVLVPVTLADTLLRLAENGLFRPLWSTQILNETASAIETVHPNLTPEAARKRMDQMNQAFPDACVVSCAMNPISATLPDPKDIHVLAAAIAGRADAIVTNNLKDFPEDSLAAFGIHALHVDDFLLDNLDLSPDLTLRVLQEQSRATRNPAINLHTLLTRIEKAGAPRFAEVARSQLWRLGQLAEN